MSEIVVIGTNHVGTACIETMLANYGTENEMVIFDQNSDISFLGCGMALWIGEQVAGPEGLFYSDEGELEQLGVKVCISSPVESIGYDRKEITALVGGQKRFETYDRLIFATDSQPIIPPIKDVSMKKDSPEFESKLENVQFVKFCRNAEDVIERLKEKVISRVAVIGTGYIGVELAEAFQRKGKEVTLIDVAETCLTGYYDRGLSDAMANNLQEHDVHLAFGEAVQEIVGKTKTEGIITDRSEYDVGMTILAVGLRPNTTLARDEIKSLPNGASLVDKYQETSMPDVYAIGDYTTIYSNTAQSTDYITLALNVVHTGIVAAHNACGHRLGKAGVQGSNGISVYGLDMVSTGLALEEAKAKGFDAPEVEYADNQRPEFIQKDSFQVTLKIVYDKTSRVILDARIMVKKDVLMGIHLLSLAIQEQVTIDELTLTDLLFLLHFNKPYNYIAMAALDAK